MTLIQEILLWIGNHFHTDVYMVYTKIQGLLWSLADIALVFFLLKIADHARALHQKQRIVWRYRLLWFSALITPGLLLMKTPNQFLLLECLICGTQFAILVFTVIAERKDAIILLEKLCISEEK
jgi:hypothetical protein